MKKLMFLMTMLFGFITMATAQITPNNCKIPVKPGINCTMIYDPVCGCDGVTYGNACVARFQHGVLYWTPGTCEGGPLDTRAGISQNIPLKENVNVIAEPADRIKW